MTDAELISQLRTEIVSLRDAKITLESSIEKLNEQIEWFKRQIFGKRSEKIVATNPSEIQLFFPDLTSRSF